MTNKKKEKILSKIYWDYNIPGEKLYSILLGKASESFPGREKVFTRMLERLGWYDILDILGIDLIKELLTKEIIKKIRHAELREKYEFIRKILSGETLSFTGWGDEYYRKIKHTLFSNRWYSTR